MPNEAKAAIRIRNGSVNTRQVGQKSYHTISPIRIAVEAGVPMGWEKYVGAGGTVIGINRFGASAPGGIVMKNYGMKASTIVAKTMEKLKS